MEAKFHHEIAGFVNVFGLGKAALRLNQIHSNRWDRVHIAGEPEHFSGPRLKVRPPGGGLPFKQEPTMHAREMIGTHPAVQGQINDALIRCIEECYSCAQTCTSCADACLSERMVQELTQCIRLDQ